MAAQDDAALVTAATVAAAQATVADMRANAASPSVQASGLRRIRQEATARVTVVV